MRHRPRTKTKLLELRERLALLNLAIAALERFECTMRDEDHVPRAADEHVTVKLHIALRRLGRETSMHSVQDAI